MADDVTTNSNRVLRREKKQQFYVSRMIMSGFNLSSCLRQ